MKKITSSLLALSLFASTSLMADSVKTQDGTIEAKKIASLKDIKPASQAWQSAKATEIVLYPQTTVQMNDKEANKLNEANTAKRATVKALTDGTDIAFLIAWPDGTQSIQKGYSSTSYADGFAVQFAADAKVGALPYIGMGSEGRPVAIHIQKAVEKFYEPNGNKDVASQVNRKNTNFFGEELKEFDENVSKLADTDYQKAFVSEGFRSMTEIKGEDLKSNSEMTYENGTWKGTLSRPLADEYADLKKASFPVAFAVWDGDKKNRDGLKLLSSWVGVNVSAAADDAMLAAISAKSTGDVEAGKALYESNGCVGCHNTPNMAPNLSNIGGYSTAAYLIESMVDPSAVVVPGYNRNAHKNFEWYTLDDKGNRTSTMPPFGHLDNKSLLDLTAYLQTLKAEEGK